MDSRHSTFSYLVMRFVWSEASSRRMLAYFLRRDPRSAYTQGVGGGSGFGT